VSFVEGILRHKTDQEHKNIVATQLHTISIDPRPLGDGVHPCVRISEEFFVDCSVKGTSRAGIAGRFCTPNTKITKKSLLWNNIVTSLGSLNCRRGVDDEIYVGECASRQVGHHRHTPNSADGWSGRDLQWFQSTKEVGVTVEALVICPIRLDIP
jgi:hypothetical protein